MNLPSADALLLYKFTSSTEEDIRNFCFQRKLQKVVLRSEVKGGILGCPSCQGVFIDDAYKIALEIFNCRPGTIVAVQAAGNIFQNLYNLNIYYGISPSHDCLVEISGIGFTASDLNRHGILHERIIIPSYVDTLHESIIKREYRINGEIYRDHYREKINRFGRKQLVHEKATILTQERYNEIPITYLQDVWNDQPLIQELINNYLEYYDNGALVSMSFITSDNNVVKRWYWDVHSTSSRDVLSQSLPK
jgi:hypothetical protein